MLGAYCIAVANREEHRLTLKSKLK